MEGQRLKELRLKNKLTQEELGKMLNLTNVSISGYENGDRTPDIENLSKLADYFNVTTDYLLGRPFTPDLLEQDILKVFDENPGLSRWYSDLLKADVEDLEDLKQMWNIIKKNRM